MRNVCNKLGLCTFFTNRIFYCFGKSIAQIILRWHVQMGFIVIPGSKNVSHIKDNISLFDFALDEIDMEKMASLNRHEMIHPRTEEALARYAALYPKYETE